MRLRVVTPEGAKVEAQVSSVTAPGTAGELGILPGHVPLLTSLSIGKLAFVTGSKTVVLAVNGGFMEVHDDDVIIVTETAEEPDAIDIARARVSIERADRELAELDAQTQPEKVAQVSRRKARALNRIRIAEQHATPEALRKVREASQQAAV